MLFENRYAFCNLKRLQKARRMVSIMRQRVTPKRKQPGREFTCENIKQMIETEASKIRRVPSSIQSLNLPIIIQINPYKTYINYQSRKTIKMSKVHPEKIKKFVSQEFQEKAVVLCQFCGGQSCPQEDFRKNTVQPNAIEGLHSNWITNEILAMQRPSERLIKQYNLYTKFKNEKINTILNLQEPGEHPFCGDGLMSKAGFSYIPQGFFAQGILFFNESWEDMTATTFEHMMRIMNIFYLSIVQNKGKISVHCHAGRGRTLLVICSWLIYHDRYSAKQTIDLAVERRQGVLTRASQRQFLYEFQAQLKKRWKTFGQAEYKTFSEFVQKQNISYLKKQQRFTADKPYLHAIIVQELRTKLHQNPHQVIDGLIGSYKWTKEYENQLKELKTQIDNHLIFVDGYEKVKSIQTAILIELLYDFYDELPFTLVGAYGFQLLLQQNPKKKNKIELLQEPEIVHELGVQAMAVIIDFTHLLSEIVRKYLDIREQMGEGNQKCECLFLRIAALLCSKRKYHPKIFRQQQGLRVCKIFQYSPKKRMAYMSKDIGGLADFLSSLARDMPQNINDLDENLMKIKKIDSNLFFYLSHKGSEESSFKQNQLKSIYQKSKI